MKKSIIVLIALFSCIAFVSRANGQYRWHVIHPDRIDTFYYGFISISCSGESCSAVGVVWGSPGESHQMPDSNFIIHSTDGGLTWNSAGPIPQAIHHPGGGTDYYFDNIQQLDSLDAIAVDARVGATIQTFDGWKTFQIDTNNIQTNVVGKDTLFNGGYYYVDFSDAAEGMVNADNGLYYSTLDSGKHWDKEITGHGSSFRSYGSGMFRVFVSPNKILTTYDDWRTSDTSFIVITDSIQSSVVNPQFLTFGENDSLAVLSERFDSSTSHYYLSIAISPNLGQSWQYPLHDTVALEPTTITPINKRTIVIAGEDSSERIVMSTDQGATWQVYSVPVDNGAPYYWIQTIAVTDSGRVIANIETDSNYDGSNLLAYLEPVPSSVAPAVSSQPVFNIFPNPATGKIQITSSEGNISVLDPLGRSYAIRQTGNSLDVSSLPSGVYFVSDGHSRAKFVKE